MIPRDFFPNMPDEVFDIWLQPIAENYGWPFKKTSENIKGTTWEGVLRGAPLSFWASSTWCREQISLVADPINRHSEYLIRTLLNGYENGVPTLVADVADTKKRIGACADFIRANGTIPKPVVAIMRGREIDIIDGYHRIAALLHVGSSNGYIVPAWITLMSQENV